MENKYAVVEVCTDGVNPGVYVFDDKEKARIFLKKLWKETDDDMRKRYGKTILPDTWCDEEGDYARVTIEEDDWIYFQVVDVKNT